MGYGALLTAAAFLFLFTLGIAARGAIGGDVFVVGAIGFVIPVVSIFVIMPILQMLTNALLTEEGVRAEAHDTNGCSSGLIASPSSWGSRSTP